MLLVAVECDGYQCYDWCHVCRWPLCLCSVPQLFHCVNTSLQMRACASQTQWNYDETCGREECFGCDECEQDVGTKTWDRANNYHDTSCLLWGLSEELDTWGKTRYYSYCSIERPICNGGDCTRARHRERTDWQEPAALPLLRVSM